MLIDWLIDCHDRSSSELESLNIDLTSLTQVTQSDALLTPDYPHLLEQNPDRSIWTKTLDLGCEVTLFSGYLEYFLTFILFFWATLSLRIVSSATLITVFWRFKKDALFYDRFLLHERLYVSIWTRTGSKNAEKSMELLSRENKCMNAIEYCSHFVNVDKRYINCPFKLS